MKGKKEELFNSNPNLEAEPEAAARKEKKKGSEGEGDPSFVRVRLPAGVGSKAREAVATLRERGAQVSVDELLARFLEAIPESYFEEELIARTPEQYYLDAAASVPELREILIRHAKKGLLRGQGPKKNQSSRNSNQKRREKPNPENKPDSQHGVSNLESVESSVGR